jgi:DNA adenine methylase
MTDEAYLMLQSRRLDVDDPLVCFAGFCCSWGGKWFGGLARGHKRQREPIRAAAVTLMKRVGATRGVIFHHCSYLEIEPFPGTTIYCDPPYEGTTHGYPTPPFDHIQFWDWCRQQARRGCTVLVSEFGAPDDVECVWEMDRATLTRNHTSDRVLERLFRCVT